MRRLFHNSLVFPLAILIALNSLALSEAFGQNISDNPSFALGNGMNYSSGACCSDNVGLYGAPVSMFTNDNCYSDCGDPCLDVCDNACFSSCGTNCFDPCSNDCGGIFPFITDVANVALTPIHWVAELLTYGTYPDCGCAPNPKRAYCDPCDGCGNWAGCNYCGGQGCSSCSGSVDLNGLNYAGDNIMTSGFNDDVIQNQPTPAPQNQMQNYEEIPNNVINKQDSVSKINHRTPQQIAMRPQQMIPQNLSNKQNVAPQNIQQQRMKSPNNSQIPQQMQPIQKPIQSQIVPTNNPLQSSATQPNLNLSQNAENQQILVLPNLNQTNQVSQQTINQPKIRIYNQPFPNQQQNQIVQVAQQPQMNGTLNKIRPVNYNALNKMDQRQMIVPQRHMIPVNKSNPSNGMVQMIVVPNNQIQQPVTKIYVQQPTTLPTTKIQQATKLNQTYGK